MLPGRRCTGTASDGPGAGFIDELPGGSPRTSFEGGRFNADALVPPVNNGNQLRRVLGFIDRLPDHATVTAGGRRSLAASSDPSASGP